MMRGIFFLPDNTFKESANNGIKGLLFVMGCLFAGAFILFGSKKYHYPYTVGCFLFGVILGLVKANTSWSFDGVTDMDPRKMLMLFLPVLIFESSFAMDAHMFYKALPQCLLLAVVGFLFCTILTATFAKYALAAYGWSWLTALAFGTIVSATDPVAVVALLKEMRMPHAFTVLIEGESLLNDGVAIVMYEMLNHQIITEKPFEFSTTAIELMKTCLGAPVLGYLLGKIAELILIRIYISPVSEMTMILVLAYATYFVAEEILGISAVIAVVLYGVTLSANRMCISPESEALIRTDWRLLAVYANTLIFMIVGALVTASFSEYFSPLDAGLILGTYLTLTLLRSLMIALLFPLLRKSGYGLNWKESIILSWGGLRGAIGLALSLMLAANPLVPKSANAQKVLIQVSGIIVLTLIVNANTVKCIMKVINFKEITLVKLLSMGNAIASVSEMKAKSLRICKREWKFMKANWEWVSERTELEDPYKGGLHGDDHKMSSLFVPYGTCSECLSTILPYEPTSEEMNELNEAARKKALRALKGIFWKQFRKGLLQRRSLRVLCMAVDNVSDERDKYLTAEDVKRKYMKVSKLNHWLETKLSRLMKRMKRKKDTEFELELNDLRTSDGEFGGFRTFCLWIYFSKWFEPLTFVVVISHVIQIILDICFAYNEVEKYDYIMESMTIFYILFYTMEIVVKNIFIEFLSFIRNSACSELYYAYDIGRGFLFATDSVLKNIGMIVDFGPCAEKPVRVFQQNVREILDALDEFETNYPAVAVALKTNRAARKILNRMKIVLDRLQKRFLISDEDAKDMKSILFQMTKTVVYAPRARTFIRDILKILQAVDWMNAELSKEIYENHIIVTYYSGDIIQKAREKHGCIFIIAKGLVRVIGEKHEEEHGSQDQLPNVDSLLYFENEHTGSFHDYLTVTGTVGLLGYLQKSLSITSAVCQTDCELIQIEYSFLDDAREKFDDLIFLMWRSISIKIGLQLLRNQYRYKRLSEEDIHFRLEKAILPNLKKVTSFEVPDFVEDVLVIQGHIMDTKTGVQFIPPAYISSWARHLKLLEDVNLRSPVIVMFLLEKKYSFHNYHHWVNLEDILVL